MPAITGCSVLQSASCRHSFRLVDDRARLTGNSSVLAGCSTVQPSSRRPLRLQWAVPLSNHPPAARSDYSGLFHCPVIPPPTQITVGCSTVQSSHRPLRLQWAVPLSDHPPPTARSDFRLQWAGPLSDHPPTARSHYNGLFHYSVLPPPAQITVGCSTV